MIDYHQKTIKLRNNEHVSPSSKRMIVLTFIDAEMLSCI